MTDEQKQLIGRVFRHFKGKLYRIEGFAMDSETLELSVPSDYQVVGLSPAPTRKVDDLVAWAERNGITGKMTPEETNGNGEIDISKNSIREMLNPVQVRKSASPDAHFAVVTKLRDVIRVSHIEKIHPDYKKGADGK